MKFAAVLVFVMGSPMFADEWTPPEDPDPKKILDEAVEDRQEGRYEQALARHVWYHRHALEYQESQAGVRLSFALDYWLELGKEYPPALAQFKKIRDETTERIVREESAHANFKDFHDLESMNERLGESKKTVETFRYLDKHNSQAAQSVYSVAEPALIKSRKYQLCGDYLTPDKTWGRIVAHFENDRDLARDARFGRRHLKFANKSFINGSTTLVALLVVNDRHDEAEKIAEAAGKQLLNEAFQKQFDEQLEEALDGKVPEPWP